MKKYNVIIALFMLIAFVSCDGFLDMPPDNRTELDSGDKIARLLVSAYSDASFWWLTEFASDNTDENTGGVFTVLNEMDEPAFFWRQPDLTIQDTPHAIWNSTYGAIAAANHALAAIERLEREGYPHCLNHLRGEALLARAYGHFKLVNLFAQHYSPITGHEDLGIPYIEHPETTVNPHYERLSVAEVYARIDRDIRAGIDLIDDSHFRVARYRFNRRAAAAFAARFNLYYTRWEEAVRFADMALAGAQFRNWAEAQGEMDFQTRSNNFIDARNPANFLIRTTFSSWPIVHGPFGAGSRFSHNRRINMTETAESQGPWGNGRIVFHYGTFSFTGGLPKHQMLKFFLYFEFTDVIAQIGFRRMVQVDFTAEETLLVRAEAHAMMGNFDAALQDINTFLDHFATPAGRNLTLQRIYDFYRNPIHGQAGGMEYYTYSRPTPKKRLNPDFEIQQGMQMNLIHCILHLRRILTLHEGLRWFDIKRYGIEIYRRSIDQRTGRVTKLDRLPVGDPRRAFQIPQAVIGAGLEPNPGPNHPSSERPQSIRPSDDIFLNFPVNFPTEFSPIPEYYSTLR